MLSGKTWLQALGWVFTIVLSVVFLSSGVPKLMNQELPAIEFAVWGYPQWLLYPVGAMEVLGALAILRRDRAVLGLVMLALVTLAGIATHLRFAEWQALQLSLAHAVVLGSCAWWRKGWPGVGTVAERRQD